MTTPQKPYPRAERVRAQVKQVLAAELERLRDPGLGFVTITDVTMSPDLRNATAFYTVLGEQVVEASTADALRRATPHLRTAVARAVRLRYVPSIEFRADPVPVRTSRIDQILAEFRRSQEDE